MDLSNSDTFILQPVEHLQYSSNESSRFCGPSTKILILATSAPTNLQARLTIRQTWGSKTDLAVRGAKLLFILGLSSNDSVNVS